MNMFINKEFYRKKSIKFDNIQNIKKVISTWTSHAVPHHSTIHASSRLTSEFGWDPVL